MRFMNGWMNLIPYSVDDLLTAHGIMTRGLLEESGVFRSRPVGVVDNEGNVLHFRHASAVCPGSGDGIA